MYRISSKLFSLGANFLEFHEWAHYSGKFILGCYMKIIVDCYCRNWHGHNYVQMAGLLTPKAMGCNYSQSNSSGWMWKLILQAINALHDKRSGHMRLFSMCIATADGS